MLKQFLSRSLLPLVFAALSPLSLLADEAADQTPTILVDRFHDTLLQAMKTGAYTDRLALISEAVSQSFAIETTARISLGRHWRSLSDAEQTLAQTRMSTLIASTYAARFSNFDDQVFTIHGTKPLSKGRLQVKTSLATRTDVVTLDYQLQPTAGGWKIYDVVARGVSDLSQKRSSYNALFQDGGLAAVLREIDGSIAENASGH